MAAILSLSHRSSDPRERAKNFIKIINSKIGRSDEERIAAIIALALGMVGKVLAANTLLEVVNRSTKYSEQVKNVAVHTLDLLENKEI